MSKKKKFKKAPIIIKQNETSQTVTTKPRVSSMAKLYNVSDKRIIDFLESLGFKNIGPSTLLSREMVICIKHEYKKDKLIKDYIRGMTQTNFIDAREKSTISSSTDPPKSSYVPTVENDKPVIKKKKKKWKPFVRLILSGRSRY